MPTSYCETINIYNEPSSETLDLYEIKGYLSEKLGDVEVRLIDESVLHICDDKDMAAIAKELAEAKVRDVNARFSEVEPLYGEIEFEKKLLKNPGKRVAGILYDGFRLMSILGKLLPKDTDRLRDVHIIFTDRLFGTFDENDRRYHARVLICGLPSVISTTGVVEAPAKPKEFYALKQGYAMLGTAVPFDKLKAEFKGRFIDYDDERLTDVMKGYVMQALFYHLTGEPFCSDGGCRLYNAHWQEELLNAQLGPKEFCERHEQILARLRLQKQKNR